MIKRPRWKYVIYALMVVYVAFISINMIILNNLMENGERYTRHALGATLNMREACNAVQKSLPAVLSSYYIHIKNMRHTIVQEADKLTDAYEELSRNFNEDPKLLNMLKADLDRLVRELHEAATQLEGNLSYEIVLEYTRNKFTPTFEAIQAILNRISQKVTANMEKIHESNHERIHIIIASSIISGIIIVLFTMLYDRQVELASKELAYRQELFRQLANSVDEVFLVTVNADQYEYVPGSTRCILNLPEEDIAANPDILYGLMEPGDVAWLKDILNGNDLEETAERDVYVASLNKYLKFRIYSIFIPSIRQKRFIVVISDQTESVLHHQALTDALESANAASKAKSGFLSHMSHEIRTPMNAIIGMTTIALSRPDDAERVMDCLGKISDSSRHLLGLINDVLDMSKIESGKLAINTGNFNLHQLIENINYIVRPQTQSRNQIFDILLDDVDEEDLVGDSMRVSQVLLNILSNAFKFTPEGGRIVMQLKQINKNGNAVRIRFTISDTGIGMSEEFLKKLYTPFEQASPSMTSKYGGTGLGMPITSNLITMMGGTLNVKSAEGQGTTFFIELPFGISGEEKTVLENLPAVKILVVDDDQGTCEHAAHLLKKMGIEPQWVLSGAEAVERVRQARDAGASFDICFIDWTMPGMNGAETARAIRKVAGSDALAIIICTYDWGAIEEEAMASGADGFIAKPFFASTLHAAIDGATRKLDAAADTKPETAEKQPYDFSGKRALLVEDNEFNREIGEEFLQMANMEVEHAENGQIAVNMFTSAPQGHYDIVLMDVQMPVMNGYEATKAIRASAHADSQSIVILAMTANAFSEDVATAVAAGMNGHIAKPIDINQLYAVLARYLQPQDEEDIQV